MISIEYIKEQEKTFQDEIEELNQKVKYYMNKSNRLEKENKRLQEKLNKINEYCKYGIKEYITDDGFVEEVLKDIQEIINEEE